MLQWRPAGSFDLSQAVWQMLRKYTCLKHSFECSGAVFVSSTVWDFHIRYATKWRETIWRILVSHAKLHLILMMRHKTLTLTQGHPLKPSGRYIHQVWYSKILRSAHTVYLCVLCVSENKQRLFHCTALTDWFYNRDGVCLLRGTFCPHSVFMCFVWIWEQTAIISL
jgi:hypothetical protein